MGSKRVRGYESYSLKKVDQLRKKKFQFEKEYYAINLFVNKLRNVSKLYKKAELQIGKQNKRRQDRTGKECNNWLPERTAMTYFVT